MPRLELELEERVSTFEVTGSVVADFSHPGMTNKEIATTRSVKKTKSVFILSSTYVDECVAVE
jgi:hypothetical protein